MPYFRLKANFISKLRVKIKLEKENDFPTLNSVALILMTTPLISKEYLRVLIL